MCIHNTYIYIYIQRDRQREREGSAQGMATPIAIAIPPSINQGSPANVKEALTACSNARSSLASASAQRWGFYPLVI